MSFIYNRRDLDRYLDQMADSTIPGAAKSALNNTAKEARERLKEEFPEWMSDNGEDGFKAQSTGFTKKGFWSQFGKSKTDPEATVLIRPQQAQYMHFVVEGGVRRAGDYATTKGGPLVPVNARRNKYGNLPRTYVQTKLRKPKFFWGTIDTSNKLTGYTTGLWERMSGGGLKLHAAISQRTRHPGGFDFYGIVEKTVFERLPDNWREAKEFRKALARKRGR